MALGKFIIENTGSVWGDDFAMHWHCAYLAQLDWQRRSGRLSCSATKLKLEKDDFKISTDSWFGYMNIGFTVALYKGAAKAGLVPDILLSTESGVDVDSDPGFKKCVDIWESSWSEPHKEFLDNLSSGKSSKEQAIDTLYSELWSTHTLIIKTSLPHAKRLEDLMPELERNFGLGFCHIAELLEAMSWTFLSLEALMEIGGRYLPNLTLDEDTMISLKENRKNEYMATNQILDFYNARPVQLSIMFGFFRRLARWKIERQRMPKTLKVLTTDESHITEKMIVLGRVVAKVVFPQSILEISLWILTIVGLIVGSLYWHS